MANQYFDAIYNPNVLREKVAEQFGSKSPKRSIKRHPNRKKIEKITRSK